MKYIQRNRLNNIWVLALVGFAGGLAFAIRVKGGDPLNIASVLLTALIWSACAAILSALVAFALAESDIRRGVLSEQNPGAIVLAARVAPLDRPNLRELATWVRGTAYVGNTFTVLISTSSISIWTGGRKPRQMIEIPWSDVVTVESGGQFQRPSYGQKKYERVRVVAKDADGEHSLFFGIEELSFTGQLGHAEEARIAEILREIAELRRA
jgi:hypothetical protein